MCKINCNGGCPECAPEDHFCNQGTRFEIECEHHTYSQDGDRYCEKYQVWLQTVALSEHHYEGVRTLHCVQEEPR